MQLIYSNVPPLKQPEGTLSLHDFFEQSLAKADTVYCAVGYASRKSLFEIDALVRKFHVSKIILVLGMYCNEGFPESIYNTALEIHKSWVEDGIGKIRATRSMNYHGKVYGFYKNGNIFAASVGSHNLGALTIEASNRRQYELSMLADTPAECDEIAAHLDNIIKEPVSTVLDEIDNVNIIRAENTKLNGVEGVTRISKDDVEAYKSAQTEIKFEIPLKVPGMIPTQDFMKSNINKCYAKGRLNKKTGVVTERGWWETEIIVGNKINGDSNYPEKDKPFFVITDDGWKFLMHVSGDHKKNFESEGDLKILGYWLKGRLVAAGIVTPVDHPTDDLKNENPKLADPYRDCKGVITYAKLTYYGRTSITLAKTGNKLTDDTGTERDVWVLSFLPNPVE